MAPCAIMGKLAMAKKTVRDLTDLHGKRVLVRVDFNVPMDDQGAITNDRRVRAAIPTLKLLLDGGASCIVMSHLGRPTGDPAKDVKLRMDAVAERLRELISVPIHIAPEVVGTSTEALVQSLRPSEILLLQNLRFHPGEQKGDAAFAQQLASLADVYVNDAFGTCHRSDASMVAVPAAMKGKPRVVGLLVAKELEVLGQLLSQPKRPVVGLLGGAKVSDKIGFIKKLLGIVDHVLIGGAMTYTFMLAKGQAIGQSKAERDKLELAKELLQLGGDKLVLPVDHLVADQPKEEAKTQVVEGAIPDGWLGMDIGPKTIAMYQTVVKSAGTVVWNGPMGKYEVAAFAQGTKAMAESMAQSSGITIVGGGETAEAVEEMKLDAAMKHVSTGGGAFLEYVEGTAFKALDEIDDANERTAE